MTLSFDITAFLWTFLIGLPIGWAIATAQERRRRRRDQEDNEDRRE